MSTSLPILIGAGQHTSHPQTVDDALHPVVAMALCAERAAEDAGNRALLTQADAVHVVNILSWDLSNAPAALASAIDACPGLREYSAIGGNTPQWLVNRIADNLAAGRSRIAVLAGCEVMRSRAIAAAAGIDLGATRERLAIPQVGDTRPGSHSVEAAHAADRPIRVYPIIENALRAKEGLTLAQQRQHLGEFGERYSRVAASNPYAWFPTARSADTIVTPSSQNRMIAFPYTKYLNAVLSVDQAAAIIMTTTETARALGIAEDRWVYLHGGQDAQDIWYLSYRPDLADSPAIKACVHDALQQAKAHLDDITAFDFYSCFPCMPRLARRVLGIAHADPRPMTLTGGLPYFGGPGSNYSMHAIAEAMRVCRHDRNARVLVTANGWYCTKHAAGIYGCRPPEREWSRTLPHQFQRQFPLPPPLDIELQPTGTFQVDGYTVWHNRDGIPELGILCGRTQGGKRAWAQTEPADKDVLQAMMTEEWIGKMGQITRRDGQINRVTFGT